MLGLTGGVLSERAPDGDMAPARPNADVYQFELVDREINQGSGAIVTVRLVHRPTGGVVPDAVVFISRIDMSPDGMGDMMAPLEPLPDSLPGYYRFETDLVMEGGWALTLAAKVPGTGDIVQGRLVLSATPSHDLMLATAWLPRLGGQRS